MNQPALAKKTIKAKELISDIRNGFTDLQLMNKYEISPKTLAALGRKLIKSNLLTSDEWENRKTGVRVTKAAPQPETNCPSCGAVISNLDECPRCGILLSKINERSYSQSEYLGENRQNSTVAAGIVGLSELQQTGKITEQNEELSPEPRAMDREEWIILGAGIGVALISFLFFFFDWTFTTFKILVHELGHAIFGWLYGYPSIPAFDMLHGGGITLHMERSKLMLVLIYAGLIGLIYVYRKNIAAVIFLLSVMLIHVVTSMTVLHSIVIVFMGHGFELVIAGLFIYRALSNRSIIHPWERPLYAILGFYIIFSDTAFAYRLLTDESYMEQYLDSKDGAIDPDFVVIGSEHTHVGMRAVTIFFLICCMITPVLAYLSFRYEQYIHFVLIKLLRKDSSENSAQC